MGFLQGDMFLKSYIIRGVETQRQKQIKYTQREENGSQKRQQKRQSKTAEQSDETKTTKKKQRSPNSKTKAAKQNSEAKVAKKKRQRENNGAKTAEQGGEAKATGQLQANTDEASVPHFQADAVSSASAHLFRQEDRSARIILPKQHKQKRHGKNTTKKTTRKNDNVPHVSHGGVSGNTFDRSGTAKKTTKKTTKTRQCTPMFRVGFNSEAVR